MLQIFKSVDSIPTTGNVPELVQKRLQRRDAGRRSLEEQQAALDKLNKDLRRKAASRARKYEQEYQKEEADRNNARQQAYLSGAFYREAEPRVAFVVRIRGLKSVPPKARKALRLLRLRQINNGVFVKLNKATIEMLKIVEPYVAWGYVNVDSVRALVYKRGYVKEEGNRRPITDNATIARNLSKFGVETVEDVIHEIYTAGDNFKYVNRFMWPFKLRHPRGGYESVKKHFIEGGSCGNREHYINDLINRML